MDATMRGRSAPDWVGFLVVSCFCSGEGRVRSGGRVQSGVAAYGRVRGIPRQR
jgi:hypothetical protein